MRRWEDSHYKKIWDMRRWMFTTRLTVVFFNRHGVLKQFLKSRTTTMKRANHIKTPFSRARPLFSLESSAFVSRESPKIANLPFAFTHHIDFVSSLPHGKLGSSLLHGARRYCSGFAPFSLLSLVWFLGLFVFIYYLIVWMMKILLRGGKWLKRYFLRAEEPYDKSGKNVFFFCKQIC